jgi:hypothetical protein
MSSEDDHRDDRGEHGGEPPAPTGPSRPASSVDFSVVPRSVWISAGGALVLLIAVFLNWYKVTASIKGPLLNGSASDHISGWSSGVGGKLVALLALLALAAWVVEVFVPTVTLPAPGWMIAGGAGALSILFVLLKIVSKPDRAGHFTSAQLKSAGLDVSVSTSFGLWLSLLASIAVVVGAYLRMTESPS